MNNSQFNPALSILKLFLLRIIFLLLIHNMTFLKFHNLSLNFGLLDRSKYYTTKFTFTSKYYINLFVIVIKQIKNSKWYFYPFLYHDGKKSLQTCMFYLLNSSFLLLKLISLIILSTSPNLIIFSLWNVLLNFFLFLTSSLLEP